MPPPLAGKIALVTGASRGIGYATARALALAGAHVVAVARTYAAETASTNVRVNLFGPGPTRTRMRAMAMPGEDPLSLKTAEAVAEKILELCRPEFQETGKIYDYRAGRLLTPQPPA